MGDPVTVGLVLSGVGMVGSYVSQREAAKQQKKSQEAQERAAAAADAKQRIQAAREARIRRSEILATAGNSGMGSAGASVAGAVSSTSSQLGSNLSYMNTMQHLGKKASDANQAALDAGTMGAGFQLLGNVGNTLMKPQMPKGWQSIFEPKVTIGGG